MSRRTTSPDQLGLDISGAPELHRLFFALWPNDALRVRLLGIASLLKTREDLAGRWLEPAKYHATLHFLGDSSEFRRDQAEAAKRAVSRIQLGAFDWSLDRVDSFHGAQPPCILRSASDPPALLALWQQLREALILEGLGRSLAGQFTPHVTLAYARRTLPEPIAVPPLRWPVDTLALIHSGSTLKQYELLAQWPLR
ncbi:MAG: RNA 2',3'-cyclic phosphodiesterase [Stagnimonas sp.]|nr:RNA 2',3'-cyclic phosphodiesterase [Stagnimonas sp.]